MNPTRLFVPGALARHDPMYGHQIRRAAPDAGPVRAGAALAGAALAGLVRARDRRGTDQSP